MRLALRMPMKCWQKRARTWSITLKHSGKPAIIAVQVKKGDKSLKLRDPAGIPAWAVNVSVVGPDGMTGGKGEATIAGPAGDYLLTAVSPFGPPAMEYDVRKGRCVQQ